MRRFAHSLQVVGLLVGFYVLSLGLLAVLAVLDVFVTREAIGTPAALKLLAICYLATVGALLIVVRAAFVSTRMRKPPGIAVSPADEPLLWARVQELAAIVGTRAPRDIRLVPQVNAAVWEDARLLGLIPGKRHMMIGVPLLLGLTRAQLDVVIAHELGHFSGKDTRIGALHGRARATVVSAMVAANKNTSRIPYSGGALFAVAFSAYARMVLSVTEHGSRLQEFAADRVAAQIGGRAAAVSALRELPALDAAFDFYLDRYVTSGLELKLLPAPTEILGGFRQLLQDPGRQQELAKVRAAPPETRTGRFDSHPPLGERIAAIEALPDTAASPAGGTEPALTLLVNPAAALTGVGVKMLEQVSAGAAAVDWDRLAGAVAHREATRRADALRAVVAYQSGQPATFTALFGLVEAGRLVGVLDALPRSATANRLSATGRVARELARSELKSGTYAWALIELAATGRVGWRHSWAESGGEVIITGELDTDLGAAIEALIAPQPDTGPLRAVLHRAGVPA